MCLHSNVNYEINLLAFHVYIFFFHQNHYLCHLNLTHYFFTSIIICVILLVFCFRFFIVIIYGATLTWIVLFGIRIIVCVILMFVHFILLDLCLKILGDFMTWSRPRCPLRYHSLVHSKKIVFFRNRTNSWCRAHMYIWTCFSPLCVLSKIGISTIIYILNTHMFSNIVIMTLNYFMSTILVQNLGNVYIEGVYLFPLHQHTVSSNSTIQLHSRYITSI